MERPTFAGFAEQWSPVCFAREVKRKRPLRVQFAGAEVALFRDGDGRIGALVDRCPHRGVALSLGRVADGCLECPFHGWRFDAAGACRAVPLNELPADKRGRMAAVALPAREAGGLVWLYAGAETATEPPVPEALTDGKSSIFGLRKRWRTHWTRAMENMLDTPHLPFVHRRTIGGGIRRRMTPASVMRQEVTETAQGFSLTWHLDGAASDGRLEWVRPNGMVLHLSERPGRRMRIFAWCVPVGPNETEMIVVSARELLRWLPLMRLFDQANRLILFEDQAVVESSQPPEVPPPVEEASVATDKPTLLFRKWYLETLAGGVQPAPTLLSSSRWRSRSSSSR